MESIWYKNYPKGISQAINPESYQSILDLFNQSCESFTNHTSFVCMGAKISYGELDKKSTQFAVFLQGRGLMKGDRIALQMPNLIQFPIALFGALKAGLIVVNTNPLYTQHEMKHQFVDAGVKAIVILENFADKLQEILPETEINTIVTTRLADLHPFPQKQLINFAVKHVKKMVPKFSIPTAINMNQAIAMGRNQNLSQINLTGEDIAFLQYTGGTTGVAKGAMLTHKNILSNMLMISEWMSTVLEEGKETVITALPLYHIFSLTVNCLSFFKLGGKNILITNPRDIPGFIKTLTSTRFTVFTGVNTLFNALANHPDIKQVDFKPLKVSVAGGMALQRSVSELWNQVTQSPIAEGFGLTETSPVVCCNPIDGTERVGTIGMPLPSTDVKLIDDKGVEVPLGERGELCVKGPQVMKGYWNNPSETDIVMLSPEWLKTGDIATIDTDGFLKIVDRKKDMILVSGFNVFPNEVEDAIAKHPKVLEVAAIGEPDEKCGEIVKVFIVAKDDSLTEEEIKTFCTEELVAYKRPKSVVFKKELPKTNVGKILRRALKEF